MGTTCSWGMTNLIGEYDLWREQRIRLGLRISALNPHSCIESCGVRIQCVYLHEKERRREGGGGIVIWGNFGMGNLWPSKPCVRQGGVAVLLQLTAGVGQGNRYQ